MKSFFSDDILLTGETAKRLYQKVKDLPVIDYHCHLNQKEIAADKPLTDIGELWLSGDHYKWRAMRLCGVDERFITGEASYKEKFLKYAEIMPKLIGGPLYYFSHLELKQVFGICKPLNAASAEEIYTAANEALKGMTVQKLLKRFNVEYIATTDDPADDLADHKEHGGITVAPTFRPDKLLSFDDAAIARLGKAAKIKIKTLADFKKAILKRLDHFVSKGCRISDHGFLDFPDAYFADGEAAEEFFKIVRGESDLASEPDGDFDTDAALDGAKEGLRGYLMIWLMSEYRKRDMVCQLHFSVKRNLNAVMADKPDSGFDVMTAECNYESLAFLLDAVPDDGRPPVILYSLNPNAVAPLANISGAFRNVYMGAAWWFNDTLEGIKRNLSTIAEYAALGTHLGMLTDSRSFLSYSRFDFFRRILCNYVGEKVDGGEYDEAAAGGLCKDICYGNIKSVLNKGTGVSK